MPHHAVIKESSYTTKLRIVFDASVRTSSNLSLNDVVIVRPTIQAKLFTHLVRFRTYKYVLTADIQKMYLQVLVYQWYERFKSGREAVEDDTRPGRPSTSKTDENVDEIRQLLIENRKLTIREIAETTNISFGSVQSILREDLGLSRVTARLYVDDLLTGAETINDARTIRSEVTALLAKGGFTIRQWASNDERIIEGMASDALHASFVVDMDRSLKTLGITWNAREDKICYVAYPVNISNRVTKRIILSGTAKIYDPLGLVGPVVFYAKRLMQDVWRCNVQWDESVPQEIHTQWMQFVQQLESMG
ncbi:PREDICTED: uncharacterized protein LOC108778481 [Cyphomyrmex costatus]|uniref:uncharacterized protein LOC108778481 n=1 Tax=Cyphomyrmex costatus TaxID=456900 RepID=UPI0008523123|nr:PREDICTED: uncharacterized protein LOC108778481 [Cyphomyrmex costatus]